MEDNDRLSPDGTQHIKTYRAPAGFAESAIRVQIRRYLSAFSITVIYFKRENTCILLLALPIIVKCDTLTQVVTLVSGRKLEIENCGERNIRHHDILHVIIKRNQ